MSKFKLSIRGFTCCVCVFLLFASCGTPTPPIPIDEFPEPGGYQGTIYPQVADRYGDFNENGVIDMPNTLAYVRSPLQVTINLSGLARKYPTHYPYENAEDAGFENTEGPWRWTFEPAESGSVQPCQLLAPESSVEGLEARKFTGTYKIITYSNKPELVIGLCEGKWTVEFARTNAVGTPIYWRTLDFEVHDFLIVQIGDSYSSGEGSPDRDAQSGYWGDDGTGGNGDHRSAHRSSYAWGSVLALQMEETLSYASVTYINFAESGAMFEDIRGQLIDVSNVLYSREIDALLISIGGNDAGFSNAIAAYIAREPIDNLPDFGPDLEDIENAIGSGNWLGGSFTDVGSVALQVFGLLSEDLKWDNRLGLDDIASGYEGLARQFEEFNIDPTKVHILLYPDPFVADPDDPGAVCPDAVLTGIVEDRGRRFEIGRKEQKHARANFMIPLNEEIAAAASKFGWNVIPADKAFYGYGICESDRMVVRHGDSMNNQGDEYGTMHPNEAGHRAIAETYRDELFKFLWVSD